MLYGGPNAWETAVSLKRGKLWELKVNASVREGSFENGRLTWPLGM